MHFCFSILGVCHFHHKVMRKAIKRLVPICVDTWQGIRKHYKDEHTIIAHALASQRFSEMTQDPIPFPSTRLRRTWAFAHIRGVYLSNACINPK
jgi:hypothetical protein